MKTDLLMKVMILMNASPCVIVLCGMVGRCQYILFVIKNAIVVIIHKNVDALKVNIFTLFCNNNLLLPTKSLNKFTVIATYMAAKSWYGEIKAKSLLCH